MVNLGLLYEHGCTVSGLKEDKKKSMQLYRMAADRGNAAAQYNIGELFELSGDEFEVEDSMAEARHWYARSAAQGWKMAVWALERLDAEC
ncbi:hypothetical protein JL721_8077 [Aureococcus anophagefferens]|nr:hypothetical protein JL722_5412 [Aureococcus anophagefferens]KAH8066884.1 hypothetical protein JL721_8077 [Aureococcus anophagefferens]KAH8086704.1 hypothetical protein JL720_7144 [Aureococcus anophagefferens]